jgi:hypothetical protein
MMAKCDMCKLRTRVNSKTGVCAPCRRNFNRVVEKYFDGDPFLPLKVAASLARQKIVRKKT